MAKNAFRNLPSSPRDDVRGDAPIAASAADLSLSVRSADTGGEDSGIAVITGVCADAVGLDIAASAPPGCLSASGTPVAVDHARRRCAVLIAASAPVHHWSFECDFRWRMVGAVIASTAIFALFGPQSASLVCSRLFGSTGTAQFRSSGVSAALMPLASRVV